MVKAISQSFSGFQPMYSCTAEGVFMKATVNFITHKTESHKSKQTYIPPVSPSVYEMLGNRPKHFGRCPSFQHDQFEILNT